MGSGELLAIGYISELDVDGLQKWLEGLVHHLGVSVSLCATNFPISPTL